MPMVSQVFWASVSNNRAASWKSGSGRSAGFMSNPQHLSFDFSEWPRRALGHQHCLTDGDGEFTPVAQRDRNMKNHAGLQRNSDVVVEAEDIAFAPIRRKRNADAVSGA